MDFDRIYIYKAIHSVRFYVNMYKCGITCDKKRCRNVLKQPSTGEEEEEEG